MSNTTKILVIGGTGAQSKAVVPELVKEKKYLVTLLTRDANSSAAKSIEALGNVILIQGSYNVEADLRRAMKDQYGVYVNLDHFSMSEGAAYFWSFRIYDIAVQSGIKHFIYSSVPNWPKMKNYAEEFRASHMLTAGRIADWISAQDTSVLPWTILIGCYYTEQLSAAHLPKIDSDGTYVFQDPIGDGAFHVVDLPQYGQFTRWALDNPSRSIGKQISLGMYAVTVKELAESFTRVTGKKARAAPVQIKDWFEMKGMPADEIIPRSVKFADKDDSLFTFTGSLTHFYGIWESLSPEDVNVYPNRDMLDEISPSRIKSVEEWMRATGFTGEEFKPVITRHALDQKKET